MATGGANAPMGTNPGETGLDTGGTHGGGGGDGGVVTDCCGKGAVGGERYGRRWRMLGRRRMRGMA